MELAKKPETEIQKITAMVQIRNLEELKSFSEFLSKSGLVPKAYQGKPADIAVCILHGHEIGLSPMASLQSIAVINGNPGMYGDAPLALVRSSGLLESIREEWDDRTNTATCFIKRVNDPVVYFGTFSKADAERIGMNDKDNYKKYPKRMYQFRARSFPLRDAFGDILKGMRQAEELEDMRDVTSESTVMPSRVSANLAAPPKGDSGVEDARQPPARTDIADQRTVASETIETESQEAPKPAEPADSATLEQLKADIRDWIDNMPEPELMRPDTTDNLFDRLKPIPDSDQDRSKIANQFIKRKQATWKVWREQQEKK